jgi:hypothetical protein
MADIEDFSEKEIRNAILNKASLTKINKNAPHWKGYIYDGDVLLAKVKIPNDHARVMHANKSQFIANDLHLPAEQFNLFVECKIKTGQYWDMLRARERRT